MFISSDHIETGSKSSTVICSWHSQLFCFALLFLTIECVLWLTELKKCWIMDTINKKYLSNILAILISPRPFLKLIRVVEAWARMCPPIGFLGSAWNLKKKKVDRKKKTSLKNFKHKNSSRLSIMKKMCHLLRHSCTGISCHLVGDKHCYVVL